MGTDVSHLLTKKTFPAIRWDLRNIRLQCRTCHISHHNGDPAYLDRWKAERVSGGIMDLRRDGREPEPDLWEVETALKSGLSNQTN
jgi:hypothetical protein